LSSFVFKLFFFISGEQGPPGEPGVVKEGPPVQGPPGEPGPDGEPVGF